MVKIESNYSSNATLILFNYSSHYPKSYFKVQSRLQVWLAYLYNYLVEVTLSQATLFHKPCYV